MADNQKTLKAPVAFSGKGLHTGMESNMTVHPAPAGSGIVFRRTDLEGRPEIPALADYVTDTSRGTTIEKGGAKVCTIEHIMSALWTLGIDNAVVEIDAPETPIMDGSAKDFAAALSETGLEEQEAERQYYEVRETIEFDYPEKNASIVIYPDSKFSVSVHVDYHSRVVGNQYATFSEEEDYAKEIAPCRTFAFLHELEPLLAANLIKGGDLDNAIVVAEKEVSDAELERLARVFDKKDIRITDGYVNNLQLRFINEIARHKLLDVLGDLALLGMRIKGRVLANRPGHFVNTETARALKRNIKRDANRPSFVYDPTAEPVYDQPYSAHPAPPPAVPARGQDIPHRRNERSRHQERHHERTLLRRALPGRTCNAGRAHHRGHGTVRRDTRPQQRTRPGELLHLFPPHRQCAVQEQGGTGRYAPVRAETHGTHPARHCCHGSESVCGRQAHHGSVADGTGSQKQGMTARKAAPSRRAAFSTICKPVRRAPAVRLPLGGKRKETRPGK